jgi:beta-lactamase superfamily II metal-dependent hydrolase
MDKSRVLRSALLFAATAVSLSAAGTLDIYFIDVDHGNAVLLVTPGGQSMLFDSGQPGDVYVNRILSAMQTAGLKQLDYVVISHYDWDHYGTVPALAEKIPIRNFVDHGRNIREVQTPEARERDSGGRGIDKLFLAYSDARKKGKHIVAKPGDLIPVGEVELRIVASAGNLLMEPLPGAGSTNPACAQTQAHTDDGTEDGQSVARLVTYGKFRFADFGDLTWNRSMRLFCPRSLVGTVDAYVITHHGISMDPLANGVWEWAYSSAPPAEVFALHPRVAFLLAGEDFVGRVSTAEAWQRVRHSPGLEDIWQVHYVGEGGPENNAPEPFIANLSTRNDRAYFLKLSAAADGSFTVTNSRNSHSKRYPARKEAQ